MDEAQLAETRRWAERTAERGASLELRAAARAILMLSDEVERLRARLDDNERLGARPGTSEGLRARLREEKPPRGRERRPLQPPARSGGGPLLFDQESDEDAAPRALARPPVPTLDEPEQLRVGTLLLEPPDENGHELELPVPAVVRAHAPRRRRPDRGGVVLERFAEALRGRCRRMLLVATVVVALAALVAAALAAARRALAPRLVASGPAASAYLGPAAASKLTVSVRAGRQALRRQRWTLDGMDVTGRVKPVGKRLVLAVGALADGAHRVEIDVGGGFLGAHAHRRFDFTIDRRPPAIRLLRRAEAHRWQPLVLSARLSEKGTLSYEGRELAQRDGAFSLRLAAPLPPAVTLDATDLAGNTTTQHIPIRIAPRRPPAPIRAVHVTFYGWADKQLRHGVLALIAQHRINTIEIDLKDESGTIGFPAEIPLGKKIGAVQRIVDLKQLVASMHARGIRVVGRLVCFRDPILATAAWKLGRHDMVIQSPRGGPYLGSGYGGFTNFANEAVRRYQIAIAVAAAKAGVDDVLYDYVRRPDGPLSTMRFPGIRESSAERAIVAFLRESRLALKPYGTFLGASVFGVAADRPEEVAQNVPRMAREVDYISPMVYPSHWAPGEYDVANPNGEPYPIVQKSLAAFRHDVDGTGARLVPWLQDFSLGITYGANEVRAQINAARRDGIHEFLLWDPAVTYTAAALDPNAPRTKSFAKERGPKQEPADVAMPKAPAKTKKEARAMVLAPSTGLKPNELGVVPVIMHHEIRFDRVGAYDQTPAEFGAELEQLYRRHYWPVRAEDLVERKLDRVPRGWTPVVLTFDDSTQFQFFYEPDGKTIRRTTAIGVYVAFMNKHPHWSMAGTFYVLREPFAGVPQGPAILRWLVAHGFELGDHTYDHIPLDTLDATKVQQELVKGAQVITDAVPGYRIRTMALPLGAFPHPHSLAVRGSWNGVSYGPFAVFLDGAAPAPSPYSTKWRVGAIPRIRSSHLPWNGKSDFTWNMWLHKLTENPSMRYVSDGDAKHVTFPRGESSALAPRFGALARRD